ncbi:WD40-repeat-containing domain superfamily protein [Pleurotus pulmonarius]
MVWIGGGERPINIGNQSSVSFQGNGSKFATGDGNGTVKIWDIETGKELRTFEGHSWRICSLAISPDGRKIAAGTVDGTVDRTIRVWDTETGENLFGAMAGHTWPVYELAFSPDGTRLASGSDDWTVRLWDEAGKSKVLEGHSGSVWSVAFSKDHIISGSSDNTIRVWDAGSGGLVRVLRGHTSSVYCVAFSPDFKLVASCSYDGTARLWDVSSGEVLAIYDVRGSACSIAFSFDGTLVVTGSTYGKVHVWNADVLL